MTFFAELASWLTSPAFTTGPLQNRQKKNSLRRQIMEIKKQVLGEIVELTVQGRVDGYWADHLAAAVDQEIRQGSHNIRLDLSQVPFLSSAGIGTLVRLYKDLKAIQGTFAVSNCSRNVLKVLQLSKLEDILGAQTPAATLAGTISPAEVPAAPRKLDLPEAVYEL